LKEITRKDIFFNQSVPDYYATGVSPEEMMYIVRDVVVVYLACIMLVGGQSLRIYCGAQFHSRAVPAFQWERFTSNL
jgi:hypothetical protein